MTRTSTYNPDVNVRDVYTPVMMEFDGSASYYSHTNDYSVSSGWTVIGQFRWAGGDFTQASGVNRPLVYLKNSAYSKVLIAIRATNIGDGTDGCLQGYCQTSSGAVALDIFSNTDVTDGELYSFLISYDPVAGTAILILNGSDDLNTSNDTINTATLPTGSSTNYIYANPGVSRYWTGEVGFLGCIGSVLTNYSDFFDSDNNPIAQDESNWASTGWGSQPLFWNEHGFMKDNRGSAGDMTANGTIVLSDEKVVPTGNIQYPFQITDVYTPAMMVFDGSSYYSKTSVALTSASSLTFTGILNTAQIIGDQYQTLFGGFNTGTDAPFLIFAFGDTYSTDTELQNKITVEVRNSSGAYLVHLAASVDVFDEADHAIFFSFNASTGVAIFKIDGVDADDATWTNRTAPTTGTISTSLSTWRVCCAPWAVSNHMTASLGFCGLGSGYTTYSDFFDSNNNPIKQDEATWANSGWGSQPLFWNEHGCMNDNRGSASDMTASGTIVLSDEEVIVTGFDSGLIPYALTNASGQSMTGWTTVTGSFSASGTRFNGGPTSGEQQEYQEVDAANGIISENKIDSGKAYVVLEWEQSSWSASDDGWLKLEFYDESSVLIEEGTVEGLQMAVPASVYIDRNIGARIPVGTRTIRVCMLNYRNAGTNCDGYIRNIALNGYVIE